MTIKHLSKLLIFLIILLGIINFSSAIQISMQSNSLNICQCSQKTDSFTIKNDGAYSAIFTVSDNQEFVTLSDIQFELMPGQSKQVMAFIESSCDMQGKYPLEILVQTNIGIAKKFTKILTIGKCQNLKSYLAVSDDEIEPCTPVDYTIKIKNSGLFEETYKIKAKAYKKYFNLSTESITLAPQEMKSINAKLDLPCSVYGPKLIEFSVTALKNELKAILKHDLMINQYYGYSLGLEEEYHFCEEEPVNIPVKIINNVETPNEYSLKLSNNPIFAKLNTSRIELEGKEEGTFEIILNIQEGMNTGNYSFTLSTATEYGDTYNDANITLFVNDCYDPEISLSGPKKVCSGKQEFTVNVKNNGENTEEITLETAEGFAELDKDKVTLESGDEQDVILKINTEDLNKRYALWVKAVLKSGLTIEDQKTVSVKTQDKCHFIDLEKNYFEIRAHKENQIVLELENEGIVPAEYELSLEPDFWIKLNETEVYLEPEEEKEIVLLSEHTSETPFGKYKVNLTIKTNGAKYVKEITINLEDKTLAKKSYVYFSKNPCKFLTFILGLTFIILLLIVILSKKTKGRIKTKTAVKTLIILLALSVLVVLGTYLYKGVPEFYTEINTSGANPVRHIWAEDSSYQIDLFDYFEDPDNDELIFTVSEVENIETSVEGNLLTLIPEEDWFGERVIIFTATDSKEASVSSTPITLEIIDVEEKTLYNIFVKNISYVNVLLLILNFLLIFLLVLKKARKRSKLAKKIEKKSKKKKRKKRR